ncbi:unnamed protein product [Caenorhabditis brenneri]
MGSTRGIAFLLFFSIFSIVYSQDCATARLSANDVTETVQIYSNAYAITDEHVTFEIASSPPSNSFDQVSDSIRILTNNQSSCPGACTVTLNRYTDTSPGAQTNVLFFDTDHAFYLPSHYVKDNKTTFVCVANNGSCGATVPIYRYYTLSNGAVFHAYSFDQDVTNYGYNQEFFPICYAWAIPTGTVASRPSCGSLNFDIPPETLSNLNIYDNNMSGIERDHYYTTLPSTDASLVSYNQTGVLGKVLTSSKSTACSCLVKLQQQFDNQTGYFHRLDHKLIVTGQEPNRPYEEYQDTGETVYCSKRLGDCGATLPLWKHFQFYDVDTVYTTDSLPLPMSYLYPQTPLCYIWPVNYAPNISNIVTGAPAPPVGGITQLPGVTDSTISTSSATPGTGSTRLSDSATNGPSTVVSSGTVSTVSTSVSNPSTISSLGSTTTSTSNPLSTVSTISTASASTMSSSGTTISTQATSQSTVSVWGTGSPATMSSIATAPTASTTMNPTNPTSQSTISTWSTGSPSTPTTVTTVTPPSAETVSTVSPATFATATMMTPSTVSVWGTPTSLGTTATGSTVSTATQTSSVTAFTSATTTHLADSGGVTPVIVIPINSSHTMPTTPEYPVTAGEEVTEANLETEIPLEEEDFNPTPETYTLSNFLSVTTTTSSSVGSIGTSTPSTVSQGMATSAGTVPPGMNGASSASLTTSLPGITLAAPANPVTNSTGITSETTSHSPVISENATITTQAAPVFVTGPLIFNIPTAPPQTTELPTTINSTKSVTSPATIPIATPLLSTAANGSTTSHEASPATPTPQHVAQSVPTYSIVGGALDSFTNPPIIAALISSSAGSTPAPTQSQPTSSGISLIVPTVFVTNATNSMNTLSSESTTHSTVLNNIPSTATMTSITTTQEPGIIWKAGDWISNTWHSVFGGNDKNVASTSISQSPNISTTPQPIGGLVGSLINSAGNNSTSSNPISSFFNSTGNFIDQHLNSNSSDGIVNKTINWIDNKLNNTGEFISNAWDSLHSNNQTSGSFVNNTQTWIGGAMNSTGEFLSNAWNSLSDKNGTSGSFMNETQTWIGGAVNSTGDFLSNAWNSLSTNNITGSVVNNTNSWIDGAINTTGGFLTNAWNSISNGNGTSAAIVNDTKTWVGGAADSTGQFLSNAWNSLVSSKNDTVDSTNTVTFMNTSSPQINEATNGTTSNVTALASAPHSNPVGNVASVILPIVNSSTPEPKNTKVEWNGGLVSGPITK